MTTPHEPELADVPLTVVLQALSDEVRLRIVRELAAGGEAVCGALELDVSKATRSHHFRVLREAGITRTRLDGTRRYVCLRTDDLDERFPGLLDAVLAVRALA